MNEDGFWSALKSELPRGHYTRVENLTQPGMPDVNFCLGGVEGWMELKYTSKFPLEHPVLQTQDLWIEQHRRAGGRAGICVGHTDLVFFLIDAFGVEVNDWDRSQFYSRSLVAVRGKVQIEKIFRAWIKFLKPAK